MNRVDEMQTAELLRRADDILILTHRNPDGDTLGGAFALLWALRALGRRVRVFSPDRVAEKYSYILQGEKPFCGEDGCAGFRPAFVAAVDAADRRMLGIGAEKFPDIALCIDHHLTNTGFAENLLLRDCAAACEPVYGVLLALGVEITPQIADCLYTGIATDTGCFRYSNVTADTHRIAAELMSLGARAEDINRLMFETKTRTFLALQRMIFDSLEWHFGGRCALITITQEMFRKSGSDESECEEIASFPRAIEGVLAGVTLRERPDGRYRVSLRTNAPVDASAICSRLGGGGHRQAAGCDLDADFEKGRRELLELIRTELGKT